MIDRIIHTHIDRMDDIEDTFNKELDRIYKQLDIDSLIDNPQSTLLDFVEFIKNRIDDVYAYKAVKEGLILSDKLKKMKRDIVIPDSENPNLNKEVMNFSEQT